MMLMPINNQQPSSQIVDNCFYSSLKGHINSQKCSMSFFIFRALIVNWLLISHLMNKQTNDQSVYNMLSGLFVAMTVFNIAAFIYANWTYRTFLTNSRYLNLVANTIQHSRAFDQNNVEQFGTYEEPIPGVSLKVSKEVYQYENNILMTQIDQEYKKRAQRNCAGLIAQQIGSDKWIKLWTQFFNLASIALFTYTIVLLSQGKGITSTEFIFIIAYLFTQVCSRIFIYLILLVIGLSPLFCFIFCIYTCCFKKQRKIQLPPIQQATIEVVKQCQGNCPICYQDVKIKDQVIVLKCSPKHVFHDLCIKGWTRLGKDTCPVCRATI